MTNTVTVEGNKTLGEGDDGTVQCIEAVATITLPHEDTWKFLKDDEFTIVSNAGGDVSIVGANGVTLVPSNITLSTKGESLNVKYQGSNTYLVWSIIFIALIVGTIVFNVDFIHEDLQILINYFAE